MIEVAAASKIVCLFVLVKHYALKHARAGGAS